VADGGVDADQGGLGEALAPELFQEGLRHRDEPFVRPVVAVKLVIEGEEAVEVAALGVQGGLGLAGDFGRKVERSKICQTVFRGLDEGWNVMG
jgi:hypothetical protein